VCSTTKVGGEFHPRGKVEERMKKEQEGGSWILHLYISHDDEIND